ncbi:DUF167 domain-containing protein [Methanococcus voltae]|uniref:UPF0235 protein J3E07_000827 n=1 Tax=Methanococcus voltae TaxID=2188 RepID=A0A8J7RH55_METVO|nr:DUF167 domain-containing protein [Methanococcus voltae]MBP2172668.1 uncharacterized protein (TIGR00251 family) [Methanococcus voltae]MBP2201415.1 uncharacterized protein (TIGR00251 family) [Methanococcus voltae]
MNNSPKETKSKSNLLDEVVKEAIDGTYINIDVTTNARTNEIGKINEWRKRLEIRIKQQPIEGKANKAIIKFIKSELNLKTDVEIATGSTNSQKTLFFRDLDKNTVLSKLKLL